MAALAPRRTTDEDPTTITALTARRERRSAGSSTVRMAMYFSPDGRLHHARCRRPLHFRGICADIESDFWCSVCHEHVAVPRYALSQIPVEAEAEPEHGNVVRLVVKDTEKLSTAG